MKSASSPNQTRERVTKVAEEKEPGAEWVGKTIIVSFEVKVGDLVRVDEHGDKLVVTPLAPWESAPDGKPVFRVEEGLAPGQIRIRRVRE